jgi:hypothetical protein
MSTPNDLENQKTRIQHAEAFLTDHLEETITTASKMCKLSRTTLSSSIHATSDVRQGGNNRILAAPSQEQSLN